MSEANKSKLRVAISHGDVNGISYEILLKVFSDDRILELFTPIVYGSWSVLLHWSKALNIEIGLWHQAESLGQIREGKVNLIDVASKPITISAGVPTAEAGYLAFIALEEATKSVISGGADLLVTAPINKSVMPRDLFPFPGHTQYLEHRAGKAGVSSLMLMCAQECRVALVTDHLPLRDVATQITPELIREKVRALEQGLIQDFGIVKPRIAVLGLNPHSGDGGLIGREELDIISPTLSHLFEEGHIVFGPYPADGFWSGSRFGSFDAILAMYHDQGLSPFKSLYMDEGVNVTLGLDIVRTSPDHGTGYDIAGQGIASAQSMRQAIYTGLDIVRARKNYSLANKNPLRKVYFNKGRDDESIDLSSDDSY